MAAYLYARTSTDEQVNGMGAQVERLEKEALARGWDARTVQEHASGRSVASRPLFQDVLKSLRAGDVLCVTSLSRLSRSVADFAHILERAEKGKWGVCVLDMDLDTTSAAGRMCAGMMMQVAQWEREVLSERTRAAMSHLKATGRTFGHPSTVPSDVVARIAAWRREGLSLRTIANILNESMVPGPSGGKWHPTSVRRHEGKDGQETATT